MTTDRHVHLVSFTQEAFRESIALRMEGVNSRDRRLSLRLVADLEYLDRSGLDSICLPRCDHDWPGIKWLERIMKRLSEAEERAAPPSASRAHLWSTIRTFTPARANPFAHMRPAGPAPTMRTSTLDLVDMAEGRGR